MKETLQQLIELQSIDKRLSEINELKGDLPIKVQNQEKELSDYINQNEVKDLRIKELDQISRKRNAEVEDFNIKLEKYKEQLYLVTSNKEYDALNTEIDNVKKSIADSELTILNDEEEKNELNEIIKSNSQKIESVTNALVQNKLELEKALSSTNAEEKKLNANRDLLIKNIDVRYLGSYNRLHSRNGTGMVSMIKSSCGSCYTNLPPQTVIEVKENDKIISCPSCGIFLFWDSEE